MYYSIAIFLETILVCQPNNSVPNLVGYNRWLKCLSCLIHVMVCSSDSIVLVALMYIVQLLANKDYCYEL